MKIYYADVGVLADYAQHLKDLPEADRYTRFCYNIKDEGIDQFILSILYNSTDHHLFTAEVDDETVGFGHLTRENENWELAVSVDRAHQGQGIADQLMRRMIEWGKTHGVHNVFMHCISQNTKIQHLARKHGLKTVDRDGAEITSQVELPPPTAVDYTSEFLKEQRELYDRIQNLQRQMVQNLNPFVFLKDQQVD